MSTGKKIGEMTPQEIRQLVAEKYTEVAQAPRNRYKFRVGTEYARDLGYSVTLLDRLPPALGEAFTGVSASLVALSEAKPGETILELGCGGGAALFIDNIDQIDDAGEWATVTVAGWGMARLSCRMP